MGPLLLQLLLRLHEMGPILLQLQLQQMNNTWPPLLHALLLLLNGMRPLLLQLLLPPLRGMGCMPSALPIAWRHAPAQHLLLVPLFMAAPRQLLVLLAQLMWPLLPQLLLLLGMVELLLLAQLLGTGEPVVMLCRAAVPVAAGR